MGATKIEWAEHSWNPIVGCSRVSEGCRKCYAEAMAGRLAGMAQSLASDGVGTHRHRLYAQVTQAGRWNGKVRLDEAALEQPLKRRRRAAGRDGVA